MELNAKILESLMSREPTKNEERYIFISDNKRTCEAIMTVGFVSVYIAAKSDNFFDLESFKAFLEDRLYGFGLDNLVFVCCCLRKKTNDSIVSFCEMHGIEAKSSGWTIFREKEYLTKYEHQDTLEKELRSYIKRFEGAEVSCEELHPFHVYNADGVAKAVKDIKIVDYLMDSVTMFVVGSEPYVYEHGVYKKDERGIYLMSLIQSLIEPNLIKATTIERIYRLLIIQKKLQRCKEELNNYPAHWINFKNGMLDAKERKMRKHDPKYLAINQIPHDFDPNAAPENPAETTLMKFLAKSVPDKEDQAMLFEYMGYCMTRDTGFQKFLIITGEAGTGKSQIISLIQHIVGDANCSPLSIQDLTQRFYPSELYGKLLNACADIKAGTLNDVSNLKKATGEDILMYERKNQDPSSFRSYAKLLFSANKIPLNMDEKSNAFYRRLLILKMDRVLKEEEKDRNLLDKLKKETGYVIWLAAAWLGRLYADGKFIESANSQHEVQELYRAADSVKAFLDECMENAPGSRMDRAAVYKLYEEYCEENGRTAHKPAKFYDMLEDKGYRLGRRKEGRYVEGLKEKEEEFVDASEENPFNR